ncbi:MAG: hypothetical protein K2H87_02235, partial [Duncaniella sp.]|nr:hypothetical protein [Duncaniella sp.]
TKTSKEKFYNLDGSVSEVDMMYLDSSEFNPITIVDEQNSVVGINLEYGNGAYSMTIIEPENTCDTFERYLAKLVDGTYFRKSTCGYQYIKVPKFFVETQEEFCEILMAMGVRKAFETDEADFSNLSPLTQIAIDKVFHTAKFEVNEEGSKGEAASVYVMYPTGHHASYWISDNPFIFFITEKSSGAVVFAGKVTKL